VTVRQDLIDALEGRTPRRTPLSAYDWEMGAVTDDELGSAMQDDAWRRLLDAGLGVRHHCNTVRAVERGVEASVTEQTRDGSVYRTETKTTPVGSISKVTRDGWHYEDWIKTPHDYKVQQWIIEHTELEPDYDAFHRAEEIVGNRGVVAVCGSRLWQHRTPAMSINVDWAGTERFCMDVASEVTELHDLYEASRKLFLEEQRLLAAGPGRYVVWLENLTINMLGPRRYDELLMSVYREAVPVLVEGGKRVFVHYDGALAAIAERIAEAPFHGIDSLTEPPEGDMNYDRCREVWPNMVFWANINVDLYARPAEELAQAVIDKRRRAGKRGLAFEISEQLPANWRESIPVVLEALNNLNPNETTPPGRYRVRPPRRGGEEVL